MHPADLERIVDRTLKQLPAPRAPHTLLPRVLAAVQAWAGRPWYAREWLSWPTGWQFASAATLAVLVAGGVLLWPSASSAASEVVRSAAPAAVANVVDVTRAVGSTAEGAGATTSAIWIVWRAIFAPFVAYAVGVIALMCVACAAFATALNHIALGKAFSR